MTRSGITAYFGITDDYVPGFSEYDVFLTVLSEPLEIEELLTPEEEAAWLHFIEQDQLERESIRFRGLAAYYQNEELIAVS